MKNNFTEPAISPANLDITKEWFVWFRFTNLETGQTSLYKHRGILNNIKIKRERIKEAYVMMQSFSQKLQEGWSPITNKIKKESSRKTLIELLEEILAAKSSMRFRSKKTYQKILNKFTEYLKEKGLEKIYAYNFTSEMAFLYMDYLSTTFNYSGKTYNNHKDILRIFFNALVNRDLIKLSPFKNIEKAHEEQGKNIPFSESEKAKLREYFKTHDQHFYKACMFVYYCFIRRTELIRLKISDIDMTNKTIIIRSEVSKNKKQESVTIPRDLELLILEMKLDKYPDNYFIFGHKMVVSERMVVKPDHLSYKFRKIADSLNIDKNKSFYGHKHSGICELYNKTKDPVLIMHQARHSDIKITMIYLRSLGLMVGDKIRKVDFNF